MSVKSARQLVSIMLLVFTAQGLFASVLPVSMAMDMPNSHCTSEEDRAASSDLSGAGQQAVQDAQKPLLDHANCGSQCLCCLGFGGTALLASAFSQPLPARSGPTFEPLTLPTSHLLDFHFRPPILI